jgi:hypothetical protein
MKTKIVLLVGIFLFSSSLLADGRLSHAQIAKLEIALLKQKQLALQKRLNELTRQPTGQIQTANEIYKEHKISMTDHYSYVSKNNYEYKNWIKNHPEMENEMTSWKKRISDSRATIRAITKD